MFNGAMNGATANFNLISGGIVTATSNVNIQNGAIAAGTHSSKPARQEMPNVAKVPTKIVPNTKPTALIPLLCETAKSGVSG